MLRLLPVLAATKLRDRVKATYGNPSDYYRHSRLCYRGAMGGGFADRRGSSPELRSVHCFCDCAVNTRRWARISRVSDARLADGQPSGVTRVGNSADPCPATRVYSAVTETVYGA